MSRRFAIVLVVAARCSAPPSATPTPYAWNLPAKMPQPAIPDDNPMTEEKVELGHFLFYDPRISVNQTYSCATCHQQARAFSDGQAHAIGCTGEVHRRNAMSLTNAAYSTAYTWADPLEAKIEHQMLEPLFSIHPVELGLSDREREMLERFRHDPAYQKRFRAAFPEDGDPFTLANFTRAVASFVRTLISVSSPYAHAARHEQPLSGAAARGAQLFFSERLECYHCHGGFDFTDSARFQGSIPELAFHNTGLYNIDGNGAYPPEDTGLYEITGKPDDMGKFRAPTLLNIALTGPYFHDGSAPTLADVIAVYAAGGRTVATGPNAGDGSKSPLKEGFVLGFQLSPDEQSDLLAFLDSLTDDDFVRDPRFANPIVDCPYELPSGCEATPPSWTRDIAPIVADRCANCHAPGQVAAALPFTTRDDLAAHANSALLQVHGCTMPPPVTAPQLSADERHLVMAWLACGAPNN